MVRSRQNSKRVAMVTLGCPKNQVDSEVLAGQLMQGGMTLVGDMEEADMILINTCGFIEEAKKESIASILEAVSLKENGRDMKVYVWGCLSERYPDQIRKEIPEADGYFGVEPYEDVGRILLGRSYRWCAEAYGHRILSTPPHAAYLKIADGCDHRCTFCAIPGFKGKYRSREVKSLVAEARALAEKGVKEITLVAQDTTAYGSDLTVGTTLVTLLSELASVKGIEWIRIMYAHPSHMTEEIIEFMAEEERICRYLDVPLQHISDSVLKTMGRSMDSASIRRLIETLRERIPGLVLRTTFIVGFPGETDENFDELLDFVRTLCFERLGVFVFSPEEGTEASQMQSAVPLSIAEERYRILMETQQDISRKINRSLESNIIQVIVDGYDENQNLHYGRSEGDALDVDQTVWIQGMVRVGDIVPVEIGASSAYDLMGQPAYAETIVR
jgi:ribosomal protein S12 methylthiotransferase